MMGVNRVRRVQPEREVATAAGIKYLSTFRPHPGDGNRSQSQPQTEARQGSFHTHPPNVQGTRRRSSTRCCWRPFE